MTVSGKDLDRLKLKSCYEVSKLDAALSRQIFSLDKSGVIRRDRNCLKIKDGHLVMEKCDPGTDPTWRYKSLSKQLKSISYGGQCVAVKNGSVETLARDCDADDTLQKFMFSNLTVHDFIENL